MLDKLSSAQQPLSTPRQQESLSVSKPSVDQGAPLEQKTIIENMDKEKEKEKIESVVAGMNELMIPTHTSLRFEMHDKLEEYFVKIIDDTTNEVMKEIPSKKLLDMYAAMKEFHGLLVDKKI